MMSANIQEELDDELGKAFVAVLLAVVGLLYIRRAKKPVFSEPPKLDYSTLVGVNISDKILMRRQDGTGGEKLPVPVSRALNDIKDAGFNAIRLKMQWEARLAAINEGSESEYNAKVLEFVQIANELGLKVVIEPILQWAVSSWIYHREGRSKGNGFPHEYMRYLNIPQTVTVNGVTRPTRENDIITLNGIEDTVKGHVWKNMITNPTITINGVRKPLWEHMWDHYRKVIEITKDYESVIAYQLINEPLSIAMNGKIEHIKGLGRHYSFMAQKIRTLTNKAIMFHDFMRFETIDNWGGLGSRTKTYIHLIPKYKDGTVIENTIFTFHPYGGVETMPDGTKLPSKWIVDRVKGAKKTLDPYNIPIVVTEWNIGREHPRPTTPEPYRVYFDFFKNNKIGNFYFDWSVDPPYTFHDPKYRLVRAEYPLDSTVVHKDGSVGRGNALRIDLVKQARKSVYGF